LAETQGERLPTATANALSQDWLPRWEQKITRSMRTRYCDRETGEQLGWLVSPFLNGFYYGHLAAGDVKWIDRLIDWSDAVVKRAVKEPDGYVGWPKERGASTRSVKESYTDNQLGEAMMLRPMVLMAGEILENPALKAQYGPKARQYLRLSERVFEKWDSRGAWRDVEAGGLWVVPPFGIDQKTGRWTEGYKRRKTDGFSMPANKQNLIATNRDSMWKQQVQGAQFRRIDGGRPDKRWARTAGVLWNSLASYDPTLRRVFETNHDPASWGGLSATPWWLSRRPTGVAR